MDKIGKDLLYYDHLKAESANRLASDVKVDCDHCRLEYRFYAKTRKNVTACAMCHRIICELCLKKTKVSAFESNDSTWIKMNSWVKKESFGRCPHCKYLVPNF